MVSIARHYIMGGMQDEVFMREAIQLARQGQGHVEPNPMVGAVIVRDGQIIARGYHARFGDLHAEAQALKDCLDKGIDPADSTIYVTLEPCSHYGKQPPCAKAVIDAGIKRVVVGTLDPFEPVAGKGVPMLRDAGIEVEIGVCSDEAEQLAEPYIKRGRTGLPWVIVKWAQTLDGKTATHTGDSKWISNDLSRHRVHELRARVDAIIVGVGTARADNPTLTARDVEIKRTARRVVIDPTLSLPNPCNLLDTLDQAPLTLAVNQRLFDQAPDRLKAFADMGVELLGLPILPADANDQLDLRPLLEHLSQAHNAMNILTEGGAHLTGQLLSQGLADQLIAFVAPKVLGDPNALGAAIGTTKESIAQATPLSLRSVEQLGEDVLLDYRVKTRSQ
jgi:diaminohydroxyphosphoribosylaminopyrimidine deaminase / 5-amino-6-(5-phosphoribosylamino)uracil reductase